MDHENMKMKQVTKLNQYVYKSIMHFWNIFKLNKTNIKEKKDTDLRDLYENLDLNLNQVQDVPQVPNNYKTNEELSNLLDKLLLNLEKQY